MISFRPAAAAVSAGAVLCAALLCSGCRTWSAREERAAEAFNQANSLREQGQNEEAVELYQKALQAEPHYHAASFNLALLLTELGEGEQALEILEELRGEDPENLTILRAMAWTARQAGRTEQAEEYYREALNIFRADTLALKGLAELYEQLGRLDEAVACRRFLLKIEKNAENRLALADSLRSSEQNTEALAIYRRVLVGNSDNAAALEGCAYAAEKEGFPEEAVSCFQRLAELGAEGSEEFQWHLGRILLTQTGQYQGGLSAVKAALEGGFSDEDAFAELKKAAPADVLADLKRILSETAAPAKR